MAQEPASRGIQTQKLDEILRRLEGAPEQSLHNIEVITEKILDDVTEIKDKVKKLEQVVIVGNGEPPLKEQVHHLQHGMSIISRITWIVVGVVISGAVATFIYLANTHPMP